MNVNGYGLPRLRGFPGRFLGESGNGFPKCARLLDVSDDSCEKFSKFMILSFEYLSDFYILDLFTFQGAARSVYAVSHDFGH